MKTRNKNNYNFYQKKEITADDLLPIMEKGEGYIPSDRLVRAVNVALMLQKPLLLTGLPGCGKSELAYHPAKHFEWGEVETFTTRTDSVATDLLYQYDSMAHFNCVNVSKDRELTVTDVKKFIRYQALGQAILDSSNGERRVVLIDEIDKAPRDLPNDILTIIEDMCFEVPELKTAKNASEKDWRIQGNPELKPIVIISSNSEKTLPDAFLRRCVFFHIEFPTVAELNAILLAKKTIFPNLNKDTARDYIDLFIKLKDLIIGKQPATHELILWVWWMQKNGFTAQSIYNFQKAASDRLKTAKNEELLSGMSILAKQDDDLQRVRQAIINNEVKSL